MNISSPVVESLQELAQQVRQSDPGGSDRLLMLSDAIKNNTSANAWAYADVHTMIAPDSIVESYRNDRRTTGSDRTIAMLEGLRNAIIFLPIIVTWLGISQATARYNDFIQNAVNKGNTDAYTQPFLYLWQQRFYGSLPEFWTLSNIALADVIVLIFILALTLIAFLLTNRNTARLDKEARDLRAHLNHAITGAILSLHSRPQLTANDNLELVARNLDITVNRVVDQVRATSQQSAEHLDRMAVDTTNRLDKLAVDTSGRFEKMARDLTGQFANASMQNRQQLDRVVQDITKQVDAGREYLVQLGSLTSGVVKTANEMQGTAATLQSSNVSLINSVNNLVKPAQELSKQQVQLLDIVQKSAGLLQGSATSINELATKQQTMSDNLATTLDTLTLATEAFAALGQKQSDLVSQQASFLQQIQDDSKKQGDLAVLLSDATVSAKNALSELNSGSINLRSIAVSMHEMMNMQASMTSGSNGMAPNPNMPVAVYLTRVTESYEKAAQSMERSGGALNGSAIAIQRASQQLRDVLDSLQQTSAGRP